MNVRNLYKTKPGKPHPLGATPDKKGVNFSVFSRNATDIELLLFDEHDDLDPVQIIALDPKVNKTFFFWHIYVEGLKPGIHYAYRVDGPWDLSLGHRFNKHKVLIDPYSRGNTTTLWDKDAACTAESNLHKSMRSVVIDTGNYDWEGDKPLNRHMSEQIIYELHIGGFTKSPTSGVKYPGTFRGVIEKIPYLKELGITAVELLPVFEFDDKDILRYDDNGKPLYNYWGYSTVAFFAPDAKYCVLPEQGSHINEFRDMVKALHKAGIEVILDIVFNHTNEGNHKGPTYCFKGFDNSIYYHLKPDNREYYLDYSGCGNTVNCNHPVTEKFILECLEFWVNEMHIDGFRFDEGSILARGEDGQPMIHPPVIWNIELSEALFDTKIIAEAWDAAGLYQIGYFPGYRWAEWNGRFRDDIRRFVKGDYGMIGQVANRIAGSSDIYMSTGHLPINSINFITCHDGFTMYDLVSYNNKHNLANGEQNRDGADDNYSWNCGAEGEANKPEVEELRERQLKNFTAILLLSQGVPMLLAGDEIKRTQQGNNNAYCQDNEISWFDWTLANKNKFLLRFFRNMINFRKQHSILHRPRFFTGNEFNERGLPDIMWHGCNLNNPGWDNYHSRVLAFTMGGFENDKIDLHVMFNMDSHDLDFELPVVIGRKWYRFADTALKSPDDITEPGKEKLVTKNKYQVIKHSIVILISR
ncbi:MAG: glycogen debranching protein GlgX [Bacteroidia bacterium]|nr:glycogen debranching protein GlgX [Bacteroidia bacterium]